MKALRKDRPLAIRFGRDELRRADKATKLVSQSRQKIVRRGALIRELAMRGVDEILAQASGDRRTA